MMVEEKNVEEGFEKEHKLVLQLIDGDENAFCELYAAYKDRLIYYAISFLKSSSYAEDLYQDTFAAIWQGRKFINPDSSFSGYLYTIIRNRILNHLRDIETHESFKDVILKNAIDSDENTQDTVFENDMKDIINQSLSSLTPRQREIFELSRVEQLSYKEIASRLNISVNTVQEHISLSLEKIRTYIRQHYSDLLVDSLILLFCLNS